jgi:hypothetical protein
LEALNIERMVIMEMLAVTFKGPFVFSLKERRVLVYAPICENHHVAIFSVDNEYPLCGRARKGGGYVYSLDGPGIKPNSGPIKYWNHGGSDCILDATPDAEVDPTQAKLCISVPLPEIVYGTSLATPEVVTGESPRATASAWATGLRFFYVCELDKPITLTAPEGSTEDFSPNSLGAYVSYFDIDIQHSGAEAEDAEHTDAIACFDQTMKVVGSPWWLSYGQDKHAPGGSRRKEARPGADCKSPVLFLGRPTRQRHS